MTSQVYLLDTGPLGHLVHPQATKRYAPIIAWYESTLRDGGRIRVPAIADYELRRNLLLEGLSVSLERLDALCESLYLPLDAGTWRCAARLWAEVRNAHRPTAPPQALDGDVILAAQARAVDGIVVTYNTRHLDQLVTVISFDQGCA